jgi:AAA domain/DnaB-like helicase N terminal domain/Homeodomain-like domain
MTHNTDFGDFSTSALPHNIEAEQAVLGAILINNECYNRVSDFLKPKHFIEDIHQRIFEIAGRLIRDGKLVTPVTLKDFLPPDLDIAGVTVNQYLLRLVAEATTITNVADYGHNIHELALRRQTIQIYQDAIKETQYARIDDDPLQQINSITDKLQSLVENDDHLASRRKRLRPHDLTEFLELAIKPREKLLDPILQEKSLAMLYAKRGIGKTHVALGIALAVASGTKFLKWTAPKPRRVLLVDGEMPAASLQERLASMMSSMGLDFDAGNLKILAADLIDAGGVDNLASPEAQTELDQWLEGVDLLILDNLSSLTAVVRDNDAESWGPIQGWLLKLRRRGISVLVVHHAGKGGEQRGTSRREDVLDTSISLKLPTDYSAAEGARFEVHYEKHRGFHGADAEPFEAKVEMQNGTAVWTTRKLDDVNRARVELLLAEGLSIREIAEETGIPKTTVGRIKKSLAASGGGDAG